MLTLSIRKWLLATAMTSLSTGFVFAQSTNLEIDAFLPSPVLTQSTIPSNGDVNPYGVVVIDSKFQTGSGPLHPADVLVSNFNNSNNLQGTGTTITRVTTTGTSTFFQGAAPLGLSTALGTLRRGFIVVGNMPTADGTFATVRPGSLLVINNQGQLIQTFSGPAIDGPWDMTLVDEDDSAIAFVSNALNGTVTRLDFGVSANGLTLRSWKTVASGYLHRGDPAALVVGPTGLVYDRATDILYVASTGDNAVFAVSNARHRGDSSGTGEIIYQDNVHLHGPIAMIMAPNHHLLASNSDVINSDPNQPSEIVEFTLDGQFVKQLSVDPAQGGSFGMAILTVGDRSGFAAVDDNTSSITIWQVNKP